MLTPKDAGGETTWFDVLARDVDLQRRGSKYRVIATALEAEIHAGRLKGDQRLPTVRELSERLKVSGTTISSAYQLLQQRGLVSSKVGSGTRVVAASSETTPAAHPHDRRAAPWRRRTQTTHIHRLQTAYPSAVNYASGTPNLELLPLEVLRGAWRVAIDAVQRDDLRYTGPTPTASLATALTARLERDLVPARPSDMVIGSSAQQLMTLAVRAVTELSGRSRLIVAVEEPGYPTIFDSFERLGHRLAGIRVDAEGALPSALDKVLAEGADIVLLTPRAHNPTGVSWSPARLEELAEVVAGYPEVVVIEDDQFADATDVRVGSLLTDPRLEDRVVHIRSFSKAIAPDLRLAVAVTRSRLRSQLMEEKFFADGWSSTLAQTALARAFEDPMIDDALARARSFYQTQRRELTDAILTSLAGDVVVRIPPSSGSVNVWVQLPHNTSAAEVAERAAAAGMLVATSEPFYVRVGRDDALRLNAGKVPAGGAQRVGRSLAAAIAEVANSTSQLFLHHNL